MKRFDCLDLKRGKWQRLPDMRSRRDELQVAIGPDGSVYAIGGFGYQVNQEMNADSTMEDSELIISQAN